MAFRRRAGRGAKRSFGRSASRVHRKNSARAMRGGYRI